MNRVKTVSYTHLSAAIVDRDGAPGLDVGYGEAVADQQRIRLHLGGGLGPQPLHGRRREKGMDQRVAAERMGPEIAEADLDIGQAATGEPGPGPGQRCMLEADEAAIGTRPRQPSQQAAIAAAEVDHRNRFRRQQSSQGLAGRDAAQVKRYPAAIGAPEDQQLSLIHI